MKLLAKLTFGFLLLVSVMAVYPNSKLGHDYFITWWIVARAVAIPYFFISLRVIAGDRSCLLMKTILGIFYYGSVLAIGRWFLTPIYPMLEVFVLMFVGLVPLIFWGNPHTPSTPTDVDNDTTTRAP